MSSFLSLKGLSGLSSIRGRESPGAWLLERTGLAFSIDLPQMQDAASLGQGTAEPTGRPQLHPLPRTQFLGPICSLP